MKDLTSLLGRFLRSLGVDTGSREAVKEIIRGLSGITLTLEEISIKEGVLVITSTPGKNNALRLKEDRILEALRAQNGLHVNKILYR
ncbi:MAG: hypothetical protein JWN89_593 [Parcubacteria group bacterium]|nr:hypothetical protein [Parcubacteria group bacterium]